MVRPNQRSAVLNTQLHDLIFVWYIFAAEGWRVASATILLNIIIYPLVYQL